MADFATVAELEEIMGPLGPGNRGTAVLGYASAVIRRCIRQDLDEVTGRQEEFVGGQGRHLLQLTQTPVTAVSSITEDAVAFTDFVWSRWGLIHRSDWTSWGDGPIIVTYDSGYQVGADELIAVKGICIEIAARALGGPQLGDLGQFGADVPELRGTPAAIYLTPEEKVLLSEFELVAVG